MGRTFCNEWSYNYELEKGTTSIKRSKRRVETEGVDDGMHDECGMRGISRAYPGRQTIHSSSGYEKRS